MSKIMFWFFALVLLACQKAPGNKIFLKGETGEIFYFQACARCHGIYGEGGVSRGGHVPVAFRQKEVQKRLTDVMISEAILNGRPQMPPFRAVLNEDNVKDLIRYVRTLAKKDED